MRHTGKIYVVFAIGLFAIAAQTLLFREFLGAFESNDIAVGLFFGSWFLWIALAAWLVVRCSKGTTNHASTGTSPVVDETPPTPGASPGTDWTPLLLLLYLPAFAVQYFLILHIRDYAGVASFDVFPLWKMAAWSLLANAPLSVVTGAIFPLACRWLSGVGKLPVSTVYIVESLGSFVGGLGVTLLLAAGCNLFFVFLLAALVPAVAVYLLNPRRIIGAALPLVLLASLLFRADTPLAESVNRWKWARLLPADTFRGSFQTAQADYLYGSYQGQWTIVREGGVCETIPDAESADRILAIHLAQNPRAERVLVLGSGLGVCREFLRLPQIREVTWAHYDNGYAAQANHFVPDALQIRDTRFHPLVTGDIRKFLARQEKVYDLVVVNLPDVTSSLLNRYFTAEFYALAKHALRDGGVMGVRLNAGENVLGPELAALGASAMTTLGRTFSRLVVVPGDTAWFLVADADRLTGNPDVLVQQFATNPDAATLVPPEALRSLYLPDREAAARKTYADVPLPESSLLNVDGKPLAYRFGLLLASRHSGLDITGFVEKLAGRGIIFLTVPLLLFLALLALYTFIGGGRGRRQNRLLSVWLMLGTGFVGIGTVIVLMYLFQTALGSLFLHVGLLSAVFMLGLAAGGGLVANWLGRTRRIPALILATVITVHLVVLLLLLSPVWTMLGFGYFILAFGLCGVCCGGYFPLAAAFLRESGDTDLESGGILESSDHVGAASGAGLCGVLVIPIFGSADALLLFMAILFSILVATLLCRRGYSTGAKENHTANGRGIGYFLAGIVLLAVVWAGMLWGKSEPAAPPLKTALPAKFVANHETGKALAKPPSVPAATEAPPGEARNVNVEKVGTLIREHKLSDHEALFYAPLE